MGNKFSFLEKSDGARQLTANGGRRRRPRRLEAAQEAETVPVVPIRAEVQPQAQEPPPANQPRPVGRPRTGKRSNPEYQQLTLLIKKKTLRELKEALYQAGGTEDVSDRLQSLCEEWLTSRIVMNSSK